MPNHYDTQDHEMLNWYAQGINRHDAAIKYIFKRGLPGPWVKPILLNGWTHTGGVEDFFQYRMFTQELMQHKGTIQDGASGSVAYIVIRPLWPTKDIHFFGSVKNITPIVPAVFNVSSVDGTVRVVF